MRFFPKNVYGKKRSKRRRTYQVTKTNPNLATVVIRCYDRRFRTAHHEFIRKELRLKAKDFYPIKVAGGPAGLARQEQVPDKYGAIMKDIDLAIENHKIREIIIVAHEDCRFYDKLVDRKCDPYVEKQDLPEAVRVLLEKYPNVTIRAFYGRFTGNKRRIFFEEISAALLEQTAT